MNKEHFPRWFQNDTSAVELAEALWECMQNWDDIVDDGDTSKANDTFQYLVFRMDYQPFFSANASILRPVLLSMYLDWRDATEMEKSGADPDLEKAFMLRAGIYRVYSVMAWIIGGEAHSKIAGPEIHRAYGERLEGFKKEHCSA